MAKMNSLKRMLLAGAVAASSLAYGAENQNAPAVGARDEIKPVQVERNSSLIDSGWFNVNASNIYTTAWGVPFNLTPVVNSDLGVTMGKVSADVYTNYVPKDGKVNDLEFTVSGTVLDKKDFSVNANAGYWIFPGTGFSNAKVAKVSVSPKGLPMKLNASLSAQKLWAHETRGVLYEADVNRTFPIGKANVTAGVAAAYNHKQYSGQSNFAAISPYVSANFKLTDKLDLTLTYKNQNPTSDFKPEGADQRNVFSVKLNRSFGGK